MFALLISMPRFKSTAFYRNSPKIKLPFPQKYKIFERFLIFETSMPPAAVGFAPRPPASWWAVY